MKNAITILLSFICFQVLAFQPGFDSNDAVRGNVGLTPKTIFNDNSTISSVSILNAKHTANLNANIIESKVSSGGAVVLNKQTASADMTVTTTVGSEAIRQSDYVSYQPKASVEVTLTGVMNLEDQAGVTSKIGFFTDVADMDTVTYNTGQNQGNGIFFQYDGTDWAVVWRNGANGSQVDSVFSQSSWIDPLDGTGPSGLTLDPSKVNIFVIEVGWLGAKGFKASVFLGGQVITVAQGVFEGVYSNVFMQTASLPVRYEIEQVSGSGAATMKMVCFDVRSYGPYEPSGFNISKNSDFSGETITTPEVLLSIRLDPTAVRKSIILRSAEIMRLSGGSGGDYRYEIWIGTTLTSPSWVDVGGGSQVEYDESATAFSTTNARCIYTGFGSDNTRQSIRDLSEDKDVIQSTISGEPVIVSIVIESNASNSFVGSFNWFEVE